MSEHVKMSKEALRKAIRAQEELKRRLEAAEERERQRKAEEKGKKQWWAKLRYNVSSVLTGAMDHWGVQALAGGAIVATGVTAAFAGNPWLAESAFLAALGILGKAAATVGGVSVVKDGIRYALEGQKAKDQKLLPPPKEETFEDEEEESEIDTEIELVESSEFLLRSGIVYEDET